MKEKKLVPELRFPEFSGDWEEKRLFEISEVTMGQSPSSTEYTTDELFTPLVQGNAEISSSILIISKYTKKLTKSSKLHEIIISVRAPVGNVAVNNIGDVCIGRGAASLNSDSKLLLYILKNYYSTNYWTKYSSGSMFPSIDGKSLKNTKLSFPSEKEQDKIASFLKSLEQYKKIQEKKLELYKKYKKEVLNSLTTTKKGIPEIRFSHYKEQWMSSKFNDLTSIVRFRPISRKEVLVVNNKFIENVTDQSLSMYSGYYEGELINEGKLLLFGDHTGIFKYFDSPIAVVGDGVKLFKSNNISIYFLYSILSNIKNFTEGYKRHYSKLKDIEVHYPELEEQNKIASFLQTINNHISNIDKNISNIEQFNKSILNKMLI